MASTQRLSPLLRRLVQALQRWCRQDNPPSSHVRGDSSHEGLKVPETGTPALDIQDSLSWVLATDAMATHALPIGAVHATPHPCVDAHSPAIVPPQAGLQLA